MAQSAQSPKQALLVMDMITTILPRLAGSPALPTITKAIQTAITAARQASIPVIFVGLDFRRGAVDISPLNKTFGAIAQNPQMVEILSAPWQVDPAFEVRPEDILVTKKRVSAFSGSDLEVVLRSLGIQRLVLTGIATSGIVLSTIREGADKDYSLSVLSDACADRDEEVHNLLLTKIFPNQADVLTADQWAADCAKG